MASRIALCRQEEQALQSSNVQLSKELLSPMQSLKASSWQTHTVCPLQQPSMHLLEDCKHRLQVLAAAVGSIVLSWQQFGWSLKVL